MSQPDPARDSFAILERTLLRRVLSRLDPRLRIELAALLLLTWGFIFWRARIPFHSLARAQGGSAVALAVAAALGVLALIGAAAAAWHHQRQLQERPTGPAWLALPISAGSILEHEAWRSRLRAGWAGALAPAVLAAAIGLTPWWMLAALAAAFVAALVGASRLATRLVQRQAIATAARPSDSRDAAWHLLAVATYARAAAQFRPPAWRRGSPATALAIKDLRWTRRPTPARARAPLPLVLTALSAAAWSIAAVQPEVSPELVHFLAFGLALAAAGAFAEWLLALASGDPPPLLRTLPIGAGDLWLGRMLLLSGFVALLVVVQSLAARPLAPAAMQVHLVWLGVAVYAVGLLGIHYGLTLPPSTAVRVLILTLSIAMAASLMIPLLGWILLLTAVIHSARRVPRWSRIEGTT